MLEDLAKACNGQTLRRSGDVALQSLGVAQDVVCDIPGESVVEVAELMDCAQDQGRISAFGLTAPSLSDVFIRLCENAEAEEELKRQQRTHPTEAQPTEANNELPTQAKNEHAHVAADIAKAVSLPRQTPSTTRRICILVEERFRLSTKRPSMFVPAIVLTLGLVAATILAFVDVSATIGNDEVHWEFHSQVSRKMRLRVLLSVLWYYCRSIWMQIPFCPLQILRTW